MTKKMSKEELLALGNKALAEHYNALGPEKPIAVPWKGKKDAIVERILALQESEASPAAPEPEKPAEAKPEEKPAKEKKDGRRKGQKDGDTIRAFAEGLLMEVVGHDADKRPVGHSYETILARVRAKYPDAQTSVGALRWYATHLNTQHKGDKGKPRVILPTRPKPPKAKKAA